MKTAVDCLPCYLRQAIQVGTHHPVRVERAGKRKVIDHLDEQVVELVRILFLPVQDLLKGFPFFLILIDEIGFAHKSRGL